MSSLSSPEKSPRLEITRSDIELATGKEVAACLSLRKTISVNGHLKMHIFGHEKCTGS